MALFAPSISGNALTAIVATNQATASTSYTDLTTVGPAVTLNIGVSGLALVSIAAEFNNSVAGNATYMSYAVSGASTVAAGNATSLLFQSPGGTFMQASSVYLVTGLTPGSNTFTAKYKVDGGTGNFLNRTIAVIPL